MTRRAHDPGRSDTPTSEVPSRPLAPRDRPFAAGRVAGGLVALAVAAFVVAEADPEVGSFFEVSPTAQLILAADRKVRVANASAARLLSPRGATLVGRPFTDVIAPPARPVTDRLFLALAGPDAAGQRVAVDAVLPDGRPLPVELIVVRLSREPTAGFGVVLRDLRTPPPGRLPSPIESRDSYTLAELLMANRLRELV